MTNATLMINLTREAVTKAKEIDTTTIVILVMIIAFFVIIYYYS